MNKLNGNMLKIKDPLSLYAKSGKVSQMNWDLKNDTKNKKEAILSEGTA